MATNRTNSVQMELDMYASLEPFITQAIKGSFYTSDTRPAEAVTEDAVLTVTTSDVGQVQTGRARLNIFVPDIDCGGSARVPDKNRLAVLASIDNLIIDTLECSGLPYGFELLEAAHEGKAEGREEHYVCIAMRFKRRIIN